jgi:hypothetical protein
MYSNDSAPQKEMDHACITVIAFRQSKQTQNLHLLETLCTMCIYCYYKVGKPKARGHGAYTQGVCSHIYGAYSSLQLNVSNHVYFDL